MISSVYHDRPVDPAAAAPLTETSLSSEHGNGFGFADVRGIM
jgi:hypothetical protein